MIEKIILYIWLAGLTVAAFYNTESVNELRQYVLWKLVRPKEPK